MQAMESLTAKGILPANAKPTQVQLDDQLMTAIKGCKQTVQASHNGVARWRMYVCMYCMYVCPPSLRSPL